MNAWLGPVALVLVVLVGAFVIGAATGSPLVFVKPPAPIYTMPRYRPTPPVAPAVPGEPSYLSLTSPVGGETFVQGANNTISWGGQDLRVVDVVLANARGESMGYIMSHIIYGMHPELPPPPNSVVWTAQLIAPLSSSSSQFSLSVPVPPGEYRIVVTNQLTRMSSISPKTFKIVAAPAK